MGRPKGSRKTQSIEVVGLLNPPRETFPWERQLLEQHFRQLVATEGAKGNAEPRAEADHDRP